MIVKGVQNARETTEMEQGLRRMVPQRTHQR
jgi:hypothetical protein